MKKFLLAGLLAISLGLSGCTSMTAKEAEDNLVKVLQSASQALDVLKDHPETIERAEAALSALAVLAPQTGPIHQAIVEAQAALNALQKNQGSIDKVQLALNKVIDLLEQHNAIPLGAARRSR